MSILVENRKGRSLVQWKFPLDRNGGQIDSNFELKNFQIVRQFQATCIYKDIEIKDHFITPANVFLKLTLLKTDEGENDPESVFNRERLGLPLEIWIFGCEQPLKLKRSTNFVTSTEYVTCTLETEDRWNNVTWAGKLGKLKLLIKLQEFPFCRFSEKKTMNDVLKLYVNQVLCDVTFCFEGNDAVQIGGHKLILAARSTVFAAMFADGTLEEQSEETNKINIADFRSDIFDLLLLFIYSGRIKNRLSDDDIFLLFKAADKYNIGDLRENCVLLLLPRIKRDNIHDVMTLAELYSVPNLKEAVTEFITKHSKEVAKLDNWEKIMQDFPEMGQVVNRQLCDELVSQNPPQSFAVSLLVIAVQKLVISTKSVFRNLSIIS